MKPIPAELLLLLKPYRTGDWHRCIELLQPLVEQHPDALGPRFMIGCLYVKAGQTALALVEFGRLLPLAVGQGDLFRAIAAQRQLDSLRPATASHPRRYVSIHQWFSALATPRKREAVADGELTQAAMLGLRPAEFHRMAEACVLEDLGVEPLDLDGEAEVARVVIHGRVRWALKPDEDTSLLEVVADELETIAVAHELAGRARLRLLPELPSACLRFGLAPLRAARTQPAALPPRRERRPDPGAGRGTPARPVPDPLMEPTAAIAAPFERRRETRVAVAFDTRVAMLGIAGSRVAPFVGSLLNLSPAGMAVGFAAGELRAVREILQGSLITVEIRLPGENESLRLTSRVRWVQMDPPARDAAGPPLGRVGLEFILLSGRDRVRIQDVLIAAARSGRPLDAAVAAPAAPGSPGADRGSGGTDRAA